jgi:hypothetical protein
VQDEQQYVSEPDVTAYDDDGHVVADATAEMTQWIDRMQEDNRRAVAQLKPHELARFETWLRTRTRDAPPVRPPSRPANGHAPREARNDRHRGSRRGLPPRAPARAAADAPASRERGRTTSTRSSASVATRASGNASSEPVTAARAPSAM